MERFGLYRVSYNREPKGVLYVHAVSVGEVVLALKFLRAWLRERGGSAVLATSTATGHLNGCHDIIFPRWTPWACRTRGTSGGLNPWGCAPPSSM